MKNFFISAVCIALSMFFASCEKEAEEEEQRALLEKYIAGAPLNAPIDERDGVYFVLVDTSPIEPWVAIRPGDVVEFEYAAWSFGSAVGAMFATSDDSLALKNNLKPLRMGTVTVGVGNLIGGLDKGLQRMGLGDQGVILFPFTLGYGEKNYVGIVPPASALIFDVLITKVNGVSY